MRLGGVEEAVRALSKGGVVLSQTETVVGLLADEPGLDKIREMKGRDSNKPIALLCASSKDALAFSEAASPLAAKLAELYWPGPLTLVLNRVGGGTIGVRVPDHAVVQELLLNYGSPLYATSANLSGDPAPRSLEEVNPRLCESVDVILEGATGVGMASAVVDLTRPIPRLLRAGGGLTEEKLVDLVGEWEHS